MEGCGGLWRGVEGLVRWLVGYILEAHWPPRLQLIWLPIITLTRQDDFTYGVWEGVSKVVGGWAGGCAMVHHRQRGDQRSAARSGSAGGRGVGV